MDDGYEDFGSLDHPCNGKLRGYKGGLYEGGHRVPFLIRWPGKVKAGSESGALIAHLDMAASFAALTGASIPAGECADSVNVLPALLGNSKTGRSDFVAHNGGVQGPFTLRSGSWKYITPGGGAAGYGKAKAKAKENPKKPGNQLPGVAQLFDLAADPAETLNLGADHPEKLQEMKALLAKIQGGK
jgi:arylsulfatase A-like enzyme